MVHINAPLFSRTATSEGSGHQVVPTDGRAPLQPLRDQRLHQSTTAGSGPQKLPAPSPIPTKPGMKLVAAWSSWIGSYHYMVCLCVCVRLSLKVRCCCWGHLILDLASVAGRTSGRTRSCSSAHRYQKVRVACNSSNIALAKTPRRDTTMRHKWRAPL